MMALWRKKKIANGEGPPDNSVPDGSPAAKEAAGTAEPPVKASWSRKSKGLAVLVLIVAVSLMAVSANSLQGMLFQHHAVYHILRVDQDMAYGDVNSLTNIGPRLTGTPGELAGAEYIAQMFKNSGLTGVEIQEYYVTCYEVDHASLSLVQYTKGPLGLIPNPMVSPLQLAHKTEFAVGAYSGSYSFSLDG
jgi:hypothetical protein